MNSSRLPGKVLADIEGMPAIARITRRLAICASLDNIVLATTDSATDDPLAAWAAAEGIECYRGSEDDVLNRVVEAHRSAHSDIVVEVCGDCPLIDPDVIDLAVETFLANECDVVSNTRKLSFPQGADAQVFRLADLAEVERTVADPAVREHVSLYFYEHPERYRVIHLVAPASLRAPHVRLQMDYPEDQRFINAVYERLGPRFGDDFGVAEILELLAREPALAEINRHCEERAAR